MYSYGSGTSQRDLVRALRRRGVVTSAPVAAALSAIDRVYYVPRVFAEAAYVDKPLPIGFNATISAPHMHAMAMELLEPSLGPGSSVLDVGSGSGYLCSALAALLAPTVVSALSHAAAAHTTDDAAATAPGTASDRRPERAGVTSSDLRLLGRTPAEVEATLAALSDPDGNTPAGSPGAAAPTAATATPAAAAAAATAVVDAAALAAARARAAALPAPLRARLEAELRSRVWGVEHVDGLTQQGVSNASRDPVGGALQRLGLLAMHTGDGRLGLPQYAPLSAIHVGAAAAPAVLHTLRRQLAVGGTLVIPVDAARADAAAPEDEGEGEQEEDEDDELRRPRARTRVRGERRGWASAVAAGPAAAAARLRWALFGDAQQLVRVVRTGAEEWEQSVEADVRFVPLTDRDRQTAGVDL